MDNVWAEHVQEIDDVIGEWEPDGDYPSLEEFAEWIDTETLEPIPSPVPELKEYRSVG